MLSDTEINEFHTTGWFCLPALFDSEEVEQMRRCFDGLEHAAAELRESGLHDGAMFVLDQKASEQIIKRVVWAGASQPYLLQIGADPRLTVPASQLLESAEMEQLLNQAHFKRPGDGVVFGWHQDIQHRDKGNGTWTDANGKGSFVQTLIAIDEMNGDSGPLMFVPGSCAWGPIDFGQQSYEDPDQRRELPSPYRDSEIVTVTAQPGDVLFFGPYTAHASFENRSSEYRRVLINGYAYPGANNRNYPGDGAGRLLRV